MTRLTAECGNRGMDVALEAPLGNVTVTSLIESQEASIVAGRKVGRWQT